VFVLGHRHPVLMAKMLTTIDALSSGRLIVGVGVGWWKEELTILGAPFEKRGKHGDEAIKVLKALWTQDNPSFEGEFFKFRDLGFAPKPVQKPHPPIWVGGDSPGAFRRVVTLGDGWHATSKTPAQMKDALARLREAADKAGRAFDTLEISLRFGLKDEMLASDGREVIDTMGEYKRLGLTHVLLEFRRDDLARMLEILGQVAGPIRRAVDAA
jgi:probable F420-dependent oxidoreductase